MNGQEQLQLGFERHPFAGTRLGRRIVRYPYVITSTFRLDASPIDMLSVIVQSASGAILAEDRLAARIRAENGTAVHVMTPAAMAVHWMPEQTMASERVDLSVGPGALLEFMPEPKILFPGSALAQHLTIEVDEAGTAVVADGFMIHDPSGGNAPFRRLCATIEIVRPGASLLAVDRFDLTGPIKGPGFDCHGVLVVARRLLPHERTAMTSAIMSSIDRIEGLYAAASSLPSEAGIILRLTSRSGGILRAGIRSAWAAVRFVITGTAPSRRRVVN